MFIFFLCQSWWCIHMLGAMNSRIGEKLLLLLHILLPKKIPLGLWHHGLLILCLPCCLLVQRGLMLLILSHLLLKIEG